MRLPLIKHIVSFIEDKDADFVHEAIELLENIIDAPGITDEELDVIGELLSNLSGAIEVNTEIEKGLDKKVALNGFMNRVIGSID